MKKKLLKLIFPLLTIILIFSGCKNSTSTAYSEQSSSETVSSNQAEEVFDISEDEEYSDPNDVALYIHTFGHLPENFITKSEAEALGWKNSEGNLWDVAEGKSIGGDKFGNREGLLPKAEGRQYYECDVNYSGGYRGGERIVFSNDGLIFYTNDHYSSYTQLY